MREHYTNTYIARSLLLLLLRRILAEHKSVCLCFLTPQRQQEPPDRGEDRHEHGDALLVRAVRLRVLGQGDAFGEESGGEEKPADGECGHERPEWGDTVERERRELGALGCKEGEEVDEDLCAVRPHW